MVSVIVPVYNTEQYLTNCLESLCLQTYSDVEILIIDDGSTDSSLQICKNFAQKDQRIRVVTKQNGGQASARNLGLDMAKGEFIAFVDSDDAISEDVFEKAMAAFEKYPQSDVVQFPVFMEYGSPSQYLNLKKEQFIEGNEDLYREWIEKGNVSWIVCNKIFRKQVFEELRFQNMYYEDNFMNAEILSKIAALYIIEEGRYYYYRREQSTTTSAHSLQKELDTQKVNLKIYEQVKRYKLKGAMTLIQEKILNVGISLVTNFNITSPFFSSSEIDVNFVLRSNLPKNQKIKLLLFCMFGVGFIHRTYKHKL